MGLYWNDGWRYDGVGNPAVADPLPEGSPGAGSDMVSLVRTQIAGMLVSGGGITIDVGDDGTVTLSIPDDWSW